MTTGKQEVTKILTDVIPSHFSIQVATLQNDYCGGVAEWLRRSVPNPVGFTRAGLNPVADTTNHKAAANSVVYPSEVGK